MALIISLKYHIIEILLFEEYNAWTILILLNSETVNRVQKGIPHKAVDAVKMPIPVSPKIYLCGFKSYICRWSEIKTTIVLSYIYEIALF